MDSGNSGSMQSSSGGDEEYDSRAAESISALLNSSGQISSTLMLNQNQAPPSHNPPLFDSYSNYLDSFPPRSPQPPPNMNSLLNLDMAWARNLRPDPNCTDMGAGLTPQGPNRTHPYMTMTHPMPLPSGSENGARPSSSTDQPNVVRNSKKRSRASRRAPTTVLTTDTSNFRAMVQEFTGIPAPPFSASSFPRTRLDLFNTSSALRSGLSETASPPPYLLRPFVQKVQARPSFSSFPLSSSSSTMNDVVSSSSTANSISISANATSTSTTTTTTTATLHLASTGNYPLPSDLGLPPKHMQNPMFTFQSLLQSSPPKYPSSQGPMTGGSTDSQLRMGMLEGFSMNQGHVNTHHGGGTLANLISSDGRRDDPLSWGDGVGTSGGDQGQLRSFDGNYSNSQRVSSCKVNYTTSSSDFHVEKGSENVASRGEGMVDSWICSSD